MRIGYSIIADKRREEWVEGLVDFFTTKGSTPPFVSWDRNRDVWDTARTAWGRWVGTSVDWVVVLEDDALPHSEAATLIPQALRMLTHHQAPTPHSPVSFYLGSTLPDNAAVKWAVANNPDASFFTHYRINHGVAVAIPRHLVEEVVEEGDRRNIAEYPFRLSKYFEKNRIRCWYTNPSIVEHRDAGSLVKEDRGDARAPKPRKALRMLGEGETMKLYGKVVKVPRG